VKRNLILAGLFSGLFAGCAQVPTVLTSAPLISAATQTGATAPTGPTLSRPACLGCQSDPRTAYAISRPGPCNDYPVTYRVQVPNERDKVLPVDQVTLSSSTGTVVAQASNACYTPR
jgi:hypothetical protein